MSLNDDTKIDAKLQNQPAPVGGRYTPIAGTFVRCAKCCRDFRSTLTFKTLHDFEHATSVGFIAQCPNCYTIFDCNRSNTYCELAPREHGAISEVVPMSARGRAG